MFDLIIDQISQVTLHAPSMSVLCSLVGVCFLLLLSGFASGSEIVALSEQKANGIINEATKKCTYLYNVTKNNIDKMLKSVEIYLSDNLQVVKQNRDKLDVMIQNLQNDDGK